MLAKGLRLAMCLAELCILLLLLLVMPQTLDRVLAAVQDAQVNQQPPAAATTGLHNGSMLAARWVYRAVMVLHHHVQQLAPAASGCYQHRVQEQMWTHWVVVESFFDGSTRAPAVCS
jgi:hypothetical protein